MSQEVACSKYRGLKFRASGFAATVARLSRSALGSAAKRRRIPAFAGIAFLAALAALACSGSDGGPVGTDSPQGPELAGPTSACPEPYNTAINENFTGGNRTAAKAQCVNILRDYAQGNTAGAAEKTAAICQFEQEHSAPPPGEVCALFLGNLFGIDVPPGTIEEGGFITSFVPSEGGTFAAPNGDFGVFFPPDEGRGNRSLFAFSQGPPCFPEEPIAQHEECVDWNLIPNDPFPHHPATFGHCAFFPDPPFDPAGLRLAKEFDDPADADDGVVMGGIVVFDPPAALPPELEGMLTCSGGPTVGEGPFFGTPPITAVRPAPGGLTAGASWPGLSFDKGRGEGGLRLAATSKPIGGTGSSTSDWGIVDITEEETTIEGVISDGSTETQPPISGASVDLFCGDDEVNESPRQSAVTGSDGSYSFPADASEGGFEVGDTCDVHASAAGFFFNNSGDFIVESGTNTKNIALDPSD